MLDQHLPTQGHCCANAIGINEIRTMLFMMREIHRSAFLLLIVAFAAARPLHSTAVSTTWECDAGYFRSTPLSNTFYDADDAALPTLLLLQSTSTSSPRPSSATCIRCSDVVGCEAGWRVAECTSTMDAACVQCPSPPSGKVYYGSDR